MSLALFADALAYKNPKTPCSCSARCFLSGLYRFLTAQAYYSKKTVIDKAKRIWHNICDIMFSVDFSSEENFDTQKKRRAYDFKPMENDLS